MCWDLWVRIFLFDLLVICISGGLLSFLFYFCCIWAAHSTIRGILSWEYGM